MTFFLFLFLLGTNFQQCIEGASWPWSYCSWIYNYLCNQYLSPLKLWFEHRSWRGVCVTILWDKVSQWLATGRWVSQGTPVSFTNKTDCHYIPEILLKVTLITKPINNALKFMKFEHLFCRTQYTPDVCKWKRG